jgi:hypothetical protein
MQYLRNTNQVQTLDRGIVRGPKGVEATIGYKFTKSGADANFLLFNNGVPSYPTIDLNSTESGSTEVFPNSTVTTRMTGSSWPVDGPTLMTLHVTGSGLFFTASSYISTSVLTTNFIASESFSYGVTGSVYYQTASYEPGDCMEMFWKLRGFSYNYDYTQCDGTLVSGSNNLPTLLGSFGPILWNTLGFGGDGTNTNQIFCAPYSSSFRSAAIGNGTTVTFTNPNTDLLFGNTTLLASWIPLNSSTYDYAFIPAVRVGDPVNTLTVCTRFPEQTFLTAGQGPGASLQGEIAYNNRLSRLYITSGSPCTI